jgi:hypothetical protein
MVSVTKKTQGFVGFYRPRLLVLLSMRPANALCAWVVGRRGYCMRSANRYILYRLTEAGNEKYCYELHARSARLAYVVRVDSRASVAYLQGEHKATACTLSLRGAR